MAILGIDSIPFLPQQLIIERERLLSKLELAVQHRLTLIAAPPGYGKTTLVAQFAHRTKIPVAWHTVEKQEHDVPNLFEHCLVALSDIVPDILNVKRQPGMPASDLAILVTDHLRNSLKSSTIYVLDDIHYLIDSPRAEAWLRAFIISLPSLCHLIIVGRALPEMPLMEMVTHREILAIGQESLCFNFQEVSELAEKAGVAIDANDVQKFLFRLDGWPAGIFLALQPLPANLAALVLNGKEGPEGLFDALAEVMLDAQPTLLQEFLLASSTLSKMTSTLCQIALRLPDSSEYLSEVLNRNLFISQIAGGMVYHSLFREFLQQQFQRRNPSKFAQLHADAGHWFEADNRLEIAFDHYITAELWEEAAAIAERTAQTYSSQGKVETVLAWKTQLGRARIKTPRLLYTCAMIHRDRYEYDLAFICLTEADEMFRIQNDEIGLIQIQLLRATIDNQRGQYQKAIERAETFVHQATVPPNLYGYALAILGTAHFHLGNSETAINYLEQALPLWRDTGDKYALAQLLMTVWLAYVRVGRFNDATLCLQEALTIRRALGGNVGIVMALNNLGYHYHLLGEYQQAWLTFQEGFQINNRVPESRAESYILWSMGDLQRDRSAFDEAENLYHRALQRTGSSEPFLRSNILVSFATLRRWEGKFGEATSLALEAAQLAEAHQLVLEKLLADVTICAIRVAQGQIEATKEALEKLVVELRKHQTPTSIGHALGMCAYVALLRGDSVATHHYLKSATQTATHPANLQPLITEIFHIPPLKNYIQNYASQYEVLIEGLRHLENAQVENAQSQPIKKKSNSIPTDSLRVWSFAQEAIERDGKPVPLAAWRSLTARGLFFHLLFRGTGTREQLGLVFWPNDSANQVRQKFHTTVRRVRDAVGANVILFEDDLYFINPEIDIWCDVYEFEAAIQQACLTSPLVTHTEMQWRRALSLYRGDFLPGFDADWVIGYRESLNQMYIDALVAFANCVRIRGDVQEAITTLKQALQVEPYREDIHRSLLTCYATLGDHSLIMRQFEELKRILLHELGITPSLESLTLAESLLNSSLT